MYITDIVLCDEAGAMIPKQLKKQAEKANERIQIIDKQTDIVEHRVARTTEPCTTQDRLSIFPLD